MPITLTPACTSALIAVSLLASPAFANDDLTDRVDALFEKWNTPDSPGCAVGVVQDGELIYARGYGEADLEHDILNHAGTIFHVASVSKQFTAFAITLLGQDGALSLDDDVRAHIPELPDFGHTITLRHLIHHTSGLRDQWELLVLAGWRMDDVITHSDVMELVKRQRALNFEPGTKWMYCNTGYTLLAEVVQRVSGQSLRDFCQDRIFMPLGMESTHFHDDRRHLVPDRAYCYWPKGDGWQKAVLSYAIVGATSLFTTVEDLAKWQANFESKQVGGELVIEQMMERATLSEGREHSYAFGLMHGTFQGEKTIGHSGGDAGFVCHVVRFPDRNLSTIVLANTSAVPAAALNYKVAEIYLVSGDEEDPGKPNSGAGPQKSNYEELKTREPVEIDPEHLKRILGKYMASEVQVVVDVRFEDDELIADATGQGKQPLIAVSPNVFRFGEEANAMLEFSQEAAAPKRMTAYLSSGAVFQFERKVEDDSGPLELASLAGRYYSDELDVFYEFVVKPAEGGDHEQLYLRRRKYGDTRCMHKSGDTFVGNSGLRMTIEFERDASGEISGFNISTGRVRNLQFRRVHVRVR